MREFIQHISPILSQLSNDPSDDFKEIHTQLKLSITALSKASTWIIKTFPTQPARVAAGAVPYLELLGRTTGGWLLASSALIARSHLAENLGDPKYSQSKDAAIDLVDRERSGTAPHDLKNESNMREGQVF